jgi:hypothetical protein
MRELERKNGGKECGAAAENIIKSREENTRGANLLIA